MKHVIKVEVLENLPDIRPLIAMDTSKKLFAEGKTSGPVGPPADEIWYTSSNDQPISPTNTGVFGANYLSGESTFDTTTHKGILKFDGNVTSIGNNAFEYCTGLTSVTIPNSVTSIGNSAFEYCTGLTSVTIGNSVISIGDTAFQSCENLISVTIPNSVASIEVGAFRYCSGLTSVTIGNSVTSIGDQAFLECPNITDVSFLSTTPVNLEDEYENIIDIFGFASVYGPENLKIHVPVGYENDYIEHAEHDKGWELLAPYIISNNQ